MLETSPIILFINSQRNEPINSFQVAYYSPVFAFHRCRIGYTIVKLKLFSIDIYT